MHNPNQQFAVYLVNNGGTRARVCMDIYTFGTPLDVVVASASKKYTRFVVLDERDVQHYHSHPDDSNGAYVPL